MAYIDDKLGSGERVVYTSHQHPFVLLRAGAGSIGLFLLGLIGLIAAALLIKDVNFESLPKNILFVLGALAMFVGIVGFFFRYLLYSNEEYIITNERVIQVQGIFNKSELDSSLAKVNDVQTFQSIFGRLFNYGTVEIVTGNEAGINRLDFLANPFEFKKRMLNAKNGFYGDASDFAPSSGNRAYTQDQDGERHSRRATPIPQPNATGVYQPPVVSGYPGTAYNPNGAHINRAEIPGLIQELARLRDAGLLTEDEFQAKKSELLRRM